MHRTYYVAVIRHDHKRNDKTGKMEWMETEISKMDRPLTAKARVDNLNDKHRTKIRFYSARMVWL